MSDLHPLTVDAARSALALVQYNLAGRRDDEQALIETMEWHDLANLAGALVAMITVTLRQADELAAADGSPISPSKVILGAMSNAVTAGM